MDVDRETAVVLERFGFDESLFESLRARVAGGELSPESNLIRGSIDPPGEGDITTLPAPRKSSPLKTPWFRTCKRLAATATAAPAKPK